MRQLVSSSLARLVTSVPVTLYPWHTHFKKLHFKRQPTKSSTKSVVGLESCDNTRQPHAACVTYSVWDVETNIRIHKTSPLLLQIKQCIYTHYINLLLSPQRGKYICNRNIKVNILGRVLALISRVKRHDWQSQRPSSSQLNQAFLVPGRVRLANSHGLRR